MSKLPNNKLKLEVKSSEAEIAKFISTENAELILQTDYTTSANNYSRLGASLQDPTVNPFQVNAYLGTPDNSKIASFNVTNTDLSTTTIIRGNLVIDGSALSLGTYILNDDTDDAFSNFPRSPFSNLISERYTSLLVSNIVNTSNTIANTIDTTYASLYKEVTDIYTLENLFRGISFTYFTDADFDNLLATKTLDNIPNGSRNKYIQNKTYPSDLVVNTSLIASNFTVKSITAEKVYANKLYGDGSRLTNVYKGDGTTSTIIEGSNLFFTIERALPIIDASNINASNYIVYSFSNLLLQEFNMHYNLSNYALSTCNIFYNHTQHEFANMSNIIVANVNHLYAYLHSCNLYISNLSSDFLATSSNLVDHSVNDFANYIQTTSNQLAENLVYHVTNISNYTQAIYVFHDDLLATSNALVNDLYAYSNILIENIGMSEQSAIAYINTSSNYIHETINSYILDNSNYISSTFIDLYSYLHANSQSALTNASIVEANLNDFINNSNSIQNIANTYTSNALVNEIIAGMSNVTEYILQTEGLLSNLIITNYEITSNNIENISNYIITQTSYLTNEIISRMEITSNIVLETSNNIILNINATFDKQMDDVSADIYNISNLVANRIDALTCDEINEGVNKYFTTKRFYSNILGLSLDDIQNGVINRYIINGVYDRDLTVSCNLYASNLSIIGNDTVLMTSTINTDTLQILSSAFAPALTVKQMTSHNILEAYNYQSNLVFAVGQKKIQIGQSNIIYEPKDIVQSYIRYDFRSQTDIQKDSSANNKNLTMYGGTYALEAGRNSLLLTAGNRAEMPAETWSTYANLSISFWLNTKEFADGNKILEFKNFPTTQRYPKQALSDFSLTYSDGSGIQVNTKSSSTFLTSTTVWRLFDNNTTTQWHSGNFYIANNGTSTNSTSYFNNDTSFYGEWAMIDLGEAIVLEKYRICPSAVERSAKDFRVYATNDASSWNNTKSGLWVQIDEKLNITDYVANTHKEFIVSSQTVAYRYFALIVNKTQSNNTYQRIMLAEWDLYGKALESANISIFQSAGQLTFQINSTTVYQTAYLQNVWNHILWNIAGTSTQSYVRINGQSTQYYSKIPLTAVSYTNTLGGTANIGSMYLSDFRVITTPSNSVIENMYDYTKDTFTVNVYGTAKANNFVGSGLFIYDVNLTDKTTSELAEDPNGTNLYFTDARANIIIDSSNVHMSNLIANFSNLLMIKQSALISSESNYWTRTSNQIATFINSTYISQSNLILTTSNALIQNATSLVLNANQSNYVTTTSNFLINMFRRYDIQQSNYILTASNALATTMIQENIRTSNYVLDFTTKLRNAVTTDYRNVSNYVSNASNALFQSFIVLQTLQSNYTSNISNLFASSFPAYQVNTSNYILSMSNANATLFVQNNLNVSNYISYSSNILAGRILQLITDPVVGGQGQQSSTTYVNRWQEPEPYITTFTVDTNAFNYIQYKDGNVGIGTAYPTATLDIVTANASMNSIKVNNNIWAQTGIISSSDARIKKDIIDIDDGDALAKILSIQPKIYDYIDNHRHQNKRDVYGFIAQQIAEVIPEAVSLQKEAIPNIYCFGTIYNDILMINDDIANIDTMLVEGVQLAILCNKTKHIVTIDDIYSLNVYKIVNENNLEGSVFVYGTVVHDFHTLDKNYIYTLNVCATQDLHRKQQEMFSNLESLKEQYQFNTLLSIDETVNATKENIKNLQVAKEDILAKYDALTAEYNRVSVIHSNYMTTIAGKADINQIYNRINTLKAENARIYAENMGISSNNQVLKAKLADVANKVSSIRNILQRNNII